MSDPTRLDKAIISTLVYGDIFSFPMTAREIHCYLIGFVTTLNDIETSLQNPSSWLASQICQQEFNGIVYYSLNGIDTNIFDKRQHRAQASEQLWHKAVRYGKWIGYIPFVKHVSLTGALAVKNASDPNDDLDYFIIATKGRVWLARLFSVMLVRLCRLWGIELCPNYVLSEDSLEQHQRDLFMAHEITQMVPIMGHDVYSIMRRLNQWTATFLPNAEGAFYQELQPQKRLGRFFKHMSEWLLGGRIGNRLEQWEMRRKIHKFESQDNETRETRFDETQAKGHFIAYGDWTLQQFYERLSTYEIELEFYESAAD